MRSNRSSAIATARSASSRCAKRPAEPDEAPVTLVVLNRPTVAPNGLQRQPAVLVDHVVVDVVVQQHRQWRRADDVDEDRGERSTDLALATSGARCQRRASASERQDRVEMGDWFGITLRPAASTIVIVTTIALGMKSSCSRTATWHVPSQPAATPGARSMNRSWPPAGRWAMRIHRGGIGRRCGTLTADASATAPSGTGGGERFVSAGGRPPLDAVGGDQPQPVGGGRPRRRPGPAERTDRADSSGSRKASGEPPMVAMSDRLLCLDADVDQGAHTFVDAVLDRLGDRRRRRQG